MATAMNPFFSLYTFYKNGIVAFFYEGHEENTAKGEKRRRRKLSPPTP